MPHLLSHVRKTLVLASAASTLLFSEAPAYSQAGVAAYAVSDSPTGHVLLSQAPNRKLAVGSLTNIATAMVVLDWLDYRKKTVSEMVAIPPGVTFFPENPIGFAPGDQVSIRDLLYAALMQSDDVAAHALAFHVGEDLTPSTPTETALQRFVAQMNALARKLGMKNTLFVNPTGVEINERRLPYSCAADMALLARYAMNKSQFRFYVSQKSRQISIVHPLSPPSAYLLQNTNELVGLDSIDGVKTGTTRRGGPCVILSAPRPPESVQQGNNYVITPRRLIVVVLGSQDRFGYGRQLLQSGWQAYDAWAARGRPQGR